MSSASHDVTPSEISHIMSLALASILFSSVAQRRIDPMIARRIFLLLTTFSAIILGFQVSWVRTLRSLAAIIGTLVMQSFAVAFIDQPIVAKRTQ